MKIIQLQQNTPEWLEFRKGKIGASDCPIIMGESPWCSPLQLWERKLGISSEQVENFAMSRGKSLEEEARHAFMTETRISVTPEVIQHQTLPWLIASLDGLSIYERYAVEIKCPGKKDHELALNGFIPKHYFPQLQHQIEVTGLDMIYYFSYDGKENALIEVKRDQKYIDIMMAELLKFYKCMITCTPPELSERDYNIRMDDEWKELVKRWSYAKTDLDCAKDMEEIARARLIEASQSRNSRGFGVKVQKIMRCGSVDYSLIKELKGVDLDQYRKPASESWRITLDE